MVYPVFTYDSIKARCESDIDQFTKLNKINTIDLSITSENLLSKDSLHGIIEPVMSFMKGIMGETDYVQFISHPPSTISPIQLLHLWIARTILFYQLLIFATATFLNRELYESVYTDLDQYPWKEDLVSELENYKMGIFGSMTPTSDIDLGIQYSGTKKIYGLAYIVSRFESLFIIFTGKNSLSFDIETYADMMTLPNPNKENTDHPDYFYLDSSSFTQENLESMLPYAYRSICRNILLVDPNIVITLDHILSLFSDFTISDEIQSMMKQENARFQDELKIMRAFLMMDYEQQRYSYYDKVSAAEESKMKLATIHRNKNNTNTLHTHNTNLMCNTMVLIGDALSYRMESYTCAPTVIHVVRILQASKGSLIKYKTTMPSALCKKERIQVDPFCSIGPFGFILSILEQIGYIYRFYLKYCIGNHVELGKCNKKLTKYMERYNDGLFFYNRYIKSIKDGGKRRTRRKKRNHRPKRTIRRKN